MLPALLLSLALLQPPPGRPRTPGQGQEPTTAFDSTRALISRVGFAVADVKTGLDLYRRAVFNGPDGDVVTAGDYLMQRCHTLDTMARVAERKICRRCGDRALRQALIGYRAIMPTLRRTGARCVTRLERLTAAGEDTVVARRLRREVRAMTDLIVAGIVPYERRLAAVRVAAGWTRPPAPARPPSRR